MIDHLSLGSARFARAVLFYRDVLAPLGLQLVKHTGGEAAFGRGDDWCLFLYPTPLGRHIVGDRMHVALKAPSRSAVVAAHDAALAAEGADLFAPRERPDLAPTYFGAMFTDLDGPRIEILTHARR